MLESSSANSIPFALDDGQNEVYYAAPRFHALAEINMAWASNAVASGSIYVRPKVIGSLDQNSHHARMIEAGLGCAVIHEKSVSSPVHNWLKDCTSDFAITPNRFVHNCRSYSKVSVAHEGELSGVLHVRALLQYCPIKPL